MIINGLFNKKILQQKNSQLKKGISSGGSFSSSTYTNEIVGMELKDETNGKQFISTNSNANPQYTADTATRAGYMANHLEVDGNTQINGNMTSTSINTGSLNATESLTATGS